MTLFATHYYELTSLAGRMENVRNYNVLVREWKNELIFLYKIIPGRADRSYGIQVARLAGIRQEIIERSKDILRSLESERMQSRESATGQMGLFQRGQSDVEDKIRATEIERMTPVQAMAFLAELRELLRSDSAAGEGNA